MITEITLTNYAPAPIAERQELPGEIWEYILTFLRVKDLQNTSLVNRSFTVFTLNAALRTEKFYLKNFSDFIKKHSPNDQIQIICSVELKDANLMELKSTIRGLRSRVIDVLKNFEKKELLHLKTVSKILNKSYFFQDTLFIASLFHNYELIKEEPDPHVQITELTHIANRLRKQGEDIALSKADEIENQISIKKIELAPENPPIKVEKKRNNCIIS